MKLWTVKPHAVISGRQKKREAVVRIVDYDNTYSTKAVMPTCKREGGMIQNI